MNKILDLVGMFKGKRTYLAAAGLVGLAVFNFSTGNLPGAGHALLEGLAAIGLRLAIASQESTSQDG